MWLYFLIACVPGSLLFVLAYWLGLKRGRSERLPALISAAVTAPKTASPRKLAGAGLAAAIAAASAAGYGTRYAETVIVAQGQMPVDAEGWQCDPDPVSGQVLCVPKAESDGGTLTLDDLKARGVDGWRCSRQDAGFDLCEPIFGAPAETWVCDGGFCAPVPAP